MYALSERLPGSMAVLVEFVKSSEDLFTELVVLDEKRLYGESIWKLYERCGRDIERFRYHVRIELPIKKRASLRSAVPTRIVSRIKHRSGASDTLAARVRFGHLRIRLNA